jgi:protein O-mannosyl-transferase
MRYQSKIPRMITSSVSKIPDATNSSRPWWICALLVLAIFSAYWPVMGYAFTDFDDPQYVFKNPHVLKGLSWSGVVWAFTHFQVNWHPLTWLSHMLDAQLYGTNAGGHHATSVLFHAANAVLLFLLLKHLTGATWRSAMVAALFGLHPLHVESVAWVAERKDVLSTFFFLLALMAYTRYAELKISPAPSQNQKWYALALVWFSLGLMSKPMLVTLPFVLLLLDYWPLGRISNFKFQNAGFRFLLAEKVPFLLLSSGSCVITFLAQQSGKAVMPITSLPAEARIENAFIAYAGYLEKMFWPDSLAAFYPLYIQIDTDAAVIGIVVLLLISGMVFILRRERPYLVTGWFWYLGMLVPVIGLVQVGSQAMADRYTYVPLIGIFIALIWLVSEISTSWPYRRLIVSILSVGILAICWKLTASQVCYWQNSETLARHALAVTSENSSMQQLLGEGLIEHGKVEEARQHFVEALRICPDSVPALGDLALALVAEGKLDEAIGNCQVALKIQPGELKIHYILANTLSTQGKLSEAIAEYKTVLQIDPDHMFALNDLAWLLATAPDARFRDGSEAIRLAEHACQLSNYQVILYVGTLAAAYAEAGRFDDAVTTAQKAVALATTDNNQPLMAKNRELLGLYQNKKAYHEPAGN